MIQKIITILFIGFFSTFYSQQQNLNPNMITFPVSPEAGRLGSYGNVPVNLFYGQLDKTIELFNGKVGDLNLPINLRYNYAGFRVEESPSIIGLGWQLSVGGVVTREVRSIPDEHPNKGYYAANRAALDNYFNTGAITDYDASRFIEGQFDLEPDKYVVSVNGINFSFKIGLDGNPIFLSKHNYKLEINRNPNNNLDITGFILTDLNSNKYFFEIKETNEPFQGGANIFDDNFPNYVSSWQLSKIVTNNDSNITFTYQNDDFYSCSYYATGAFRGAMPGPQGGPLYDQGSSKDLVKRKILKSINSDSFNVLFNIIIKNDQEVYDKMTVTDFKTNVVNYYDFNFAGNRNSLIKINKNNQFFYEFDYFGDPSAYQHFMNSITQFPWNQDEWGFANDANNQYGINIWMSGYTADKSTSFSNTVLGALATIKYPTGGSTRIFYEQNTATGLLNSPNSDTEPNVRINLKFKSDNEIGAPEIKESIYTKTFATDVVATLSHTIESTAQGIIEMSISGVASCGSLYEVSNQYYNKIPGQRLMLAQATPTVCPSLYAAFDDGCTTSYCISSENSGGKFIIPAGTYEFKFKTIQNQYKDVKASVTLDFYDSEVAAFTNTKMNRNLGGVRVSKTIDDPITGNEVTKYYDYNNEDGSSTGIEFGNLINQYKYKQYYSYRVGNGFLTEIRDATDYSAKSYNLMLKSAVPVYYSSVKEYTTKNEIIVPAKFLCNTCGGNFGGNYDGSKVYSYLEGTYGAKKTSYTEGYKNTEFESPRKTPPSQYPFAPYGEDLSMGMISSIKIADKTDSNYISKLLFTENNSYIYSTQLGNSIFTDPSLNPNYPKGLKMGYKIKRIGIIPPIDPNKTINDYFLFNIYKESDIESFKSNVITKEYFNNNAIEKNEAIEYNTHLQQSKVTTADSNNNVLTNEVFYPYNFSDAVSLDMVSKNNISPLVQVVNKKNGEILESSKFDYGQISTNLFKPFSFSKSKGNNALEKRNLFNYDSKGNIITMINAYTAGTSPGGATLYNGSSTTIIWGYNKTQAVAKIETLSSLTVPAALITAIETASDTGTETALLTALTNLRNSLPINTMVTTYTYIPLIGVSTITDPKGDKITYTYDNFGRLQFVKDKNGNILSENQYNYKQ